MKITRLLPLCTLLALLGQALPCQALTLLTEDWPPVTFQNGRGVADGMAVEVVHAIQTRIGDSNPIQVQPWARAYSSLLNDGNVMLFTVGRNAERERLMTLLGPILVSSTDIVSQARNAASLRQLPPGELRKLPVAAYRGSIFASSAKAAGFQVSETNDPGQSARMLLAGRVKLWADGNVVMSRVLREQGVAPGAVEKIVTLDKLDLYLAFSANVPRDTILQWESGLKAIKQDGTFAAIHRRWFPQEQPPLQVERLGIQK
ncbi:ABC transporter substrate-binding protein [Vogesella sp. LIG4]|uniref:substrate-binding periplasmic protein n=1 Tax=Vogesella sp. LIG4 TaxID=1192162 RepID=UPI00081F77D2|nr:transporter substrate-binding domain-containing protein [Vogesella sp. LIG4]SCK30034.1 amino acid ABC transporter substrate-binding protein, PAAT family [Vogesella sp. LIG4]